MFINVTIYFSVGFRETKAGKIIDVTDQNRSRKLPQHDFAEPKVYQSPSSYRIMTWKAEEINGNTLLTMSVKSNLYMYMMYI